MVRFLYPGNQHYLQFKSLLSIAAYLLGMVFSHRIEQRKQHLLVKIVDAG